MNTPPLSVTMKNGTMHVVMSGNEPCPFCGAAHHGATTQPTVTCTRRLWAMNANLIDLLRLSRSSLREWGKYGEAMKAFGRGHDGTESATGYSNDYLVEMLNSTINSYTP